MASMNNWLGFSLSPQEHQNPQDHSQNSVSRLGFNTEEISGIDVSSDQCFDLSSDSTVLPTLNLPAPFGILEAFNRNNTHSHSQGFLIISYIYICVCVCVLFFSLQTIQEPLVKLSSTFLV